MKFKPGNTLKTWLELTKYKIMIPVSLTGFTGYFIYKPELTPHIFIISFGILLLAISASVLNQIQEIEADSKMARTWHRPLPSDKISIQAATLFFLFNFLAGLALLYYAGNIKAAFIGLITLIWYNGIYTYSKKITAFAVVPGALTGALPPLIGYVAAGGGIWEKPVIFLEFVIFTGQIPHFWLLILKYGEEYKRAGYPILTDIFSVVQISRLTFSWVVSSVFAALLLCFFEIIQNVFFVGLLLIASIYLIWQFSDLLKSSVNVKFYRKYFILLDLYYLLILILLISDKLVTPA
jgi:protoheme IX farnesyltransferase